MGRPGNIRTKLLIKAVFGPLGAIWLLLWGLEAFSGVAQAKDDHLLGTAQDVGGERSSYQQQIQVFKKDMSKGNKELRKQADRYFPAYLAK